MYSVILDVFELIKDHLEPSCVYIYLRSYGAHTLTYLVSQCLIIVFVSWNHILYKLVE